MCFAGRLVSALVVAASLAVTPAAQQAQPDEQRIREAEDARAPDAARLAIVTAGLIGRPDLQRLAVRTLGRLEREALVDRIAPLLASRDPRVRAEAVNAIGQSVVRGKAAIAWRALVVHAGAERDGSVRAVLARTFGRLPYETAEEVRRAEQMVLSLAGSAETHESVAHGLETLARRRDTLAPLGSASRTWLRERVPSAASSAFLVRTSLRALIAARDTDESIVRAAAASADEQVRRLASSAAGSAGRLEWVGAALERGLADPSFLVRSESLLGLARALGPTSCAHLLRAMDDGNPHVRLRAVDLAGTTCADDAAAVDAMARAASFSEGRPDAGSWHLPAHALVALARLSPERVREPLARAARSEVWQVRMYAARAGGAADSTAVLVGLASDPVDNVRNAAIESMSEQVRREAASTLVAALDAPDPQLLRTAAIALKGTPLRAPAVRAVAAALARTTRAQRDTSRDVRMALIDRLAELGSDEESAGAALRAHLEDFDPVVARHAARVLSTWTRREVEPRPIPRVRHPFPTAAELAECERLEAIVTMARGGRFRLRLFPEEAPTNAWRFVRLARAGWFDGLTFHRVEPGFVVQGGSPGANEYAGDGPYTRDEVGLRSHTRGTVGVSTRGRDTGDGQIFINLVDNIRLDHDYTIFGEVVDGMDAVDVIVEGDVIARVEIVQKPSDE